MQDRGAKRIFDCAVDLPSEERCAFIDAECSGQPAMRERVMQMLIAFDASDVRDAPFLLSPVNTSRTPPTTPFQGTQRFVKQRQLGAGAFGTVYQVWDAEQEVTVAAKVLHSIDPEVLLRFKREFRAAVKLRHRNLVHLHELFSEGTQWFFTMELVEGETFLAHVRPNGKECRLDRLRSALNQLAHAIQALHEAKHLHRDLKPGNVMVTSTGRVVLLDFGLIKEFKVAGLDESITFAGTPAYMSPEQAQQQALTAMSDWYALGVMLFQALTGQFPRLPHSWGSPEGNLNDELMDPGRLNVDCPDDLRALCIKLLRTKPEERACPAEILSVLTMPEDTASTASTTAGKGQQNPSDIFVGRKEQLTKLIEAFRETQKGHLRVVLVEGRSGIGKTATVKHFLNQLSETHSDVVILKGRCYEFESVPYKGLDALVDELTNYLRHLSVEEISSLLPREAFLLPRLFPVLGRIKAIETSPARSALVPDEQELRQRTFTALRELLARLSDRHPAVIWIDDLQWGDRDSSTFLAELCAPPRPPALLLILTYRSEDVTSNPTLAYLHQILTTQKILGHWRQITMSGLNDDESRRLLDELLVDRVAIGRSLESQILIEGGGHPLFLQQLAYDATSGQNTGSTTTGKELSLREVLQHRVASLPRFAREVLEFACIAAQPLSAQILFLASSSKNISDAEKAEALGVLMGETLARTSESDGERRIEAFHDQIRSAVVNMLTPETRRIRHRRLAEILSKRPNVEAQILVAHYQEAGDKEATYEYSIRAAEAAEHHLAFDRAALFYQVALNASSTPTLDPNLYRRLADTLGKAGRGYDSAQAYLRAAMATHIDAQLKLRRLAADQLMRSGHIDEARALVNELAKACGVRVPQTPRQAMLGIVWGRFQTRISFLFGIPAPTSDPVTTTDQERLELLRTAGVVMVMADPVQATYFQIKYVLSALRIRDPLHLANALSIEASIRVSTGKHNVHMATALMRQAQQIAEDTGHNNTIGFTYLCWTYCDYLLGRVPDGLEHGNRAVAYLRERCTGTAWELTAGYVLLFWCMCWSGHVERIREMLPQLLKEGAARGDKNVEISLRLLSYIHYWYLSADEPEECLRETALALQGWSKSGYHLQNYGGLFGVVETYLYMGDYTTAREQLMNDWPRMTKSFLLRWQILTIMAVFLRGRVALACWLGDRKNSTLYTEVEHCAKRLKRINSPWGQPTANILFGGLATGRGERSDAVRFLQMAYDGFDKISLHAYASAARYRCGTICGGNNGDVLCREAAEFLKSQSVKNEAAFLRMLLPGDWSVHTNG